MLWSKRRSSRQESSTSIQKPHKHQPGQVLPSRRQSIPTHSSPRLPFSLLNPLDPQGSQSSLAAASDGLSSSVADCESIGIKQKMQSPPDQSCLSPSPSLPPSIVNLPTVEMPHSASNDLYTYNSLNTFSFGSVQPQAPSLSRSVHPLSTGYIDAENVGEDACNPPDVTPRPSVFSYDNPNHSRNHPTQPPGRHRGAPSHRTHLRDDHRNRPGNNSDVGSHLETSSASASVTSLSSTSGNLSRTESRASHHTSSTNQTSAEHSSMDETDDDYDHRHPIPPYIVDTIAHDTDSSGMGTESNTAVEFSSDEDYSEDDQDYFDDDETGTNIEISSARYDGSVGTHGPWERDSYLGTGSSSASLRGQTGFAYPDRRGSIPMAVPGTGVPLDIRDPTSFSFGRNREDSFATVRRPSRSLDDDLTKLGLGRATGPLSGQAALEHPLQPSPVSVPGSDGDWKASGERSKSKGKSRETERPITSPTTTADDFDLDWAQMSGGITTLDPGVLGDIIGGSNEASGSRDRQQSGSGTKWLISWATKDARRPSTATVSSYGGDSFGKAIRNWDGVRYQAQRRDWSFKKERDDGSDVGSPSIRVATTDLLSPRGSLAAEGTIPSPGGVQLRESFKDADKGVIWKGMRLNSHEFWRNDLVGKFKVDRRATRPTDEHKGPQQRLTVHPVKDPNINAFPDGPPVTIHKHSKAIAFSISRHYRTPRKRGVIHMTSSRATDATLNSGNVASTTKQSSTMILLAPRRVQVAYTSTTTTRKLESHGLLDDAAAENLHEVKNQPRRHKERTGERHLQREKKRDKDRPRTNLEEPRERRVIKQQAKNDSYLPKGSNSIVPTLPLPTSSALLHTYPPTPAALPGSNPEGAALERTASRNSSHHSRRRRRARDPLEDDDDDDDDDDYNDNAPPTRTPHSEAFGTMDAALIEQLRQDRFHNGDSDRGGLWNRLRGRTNNSAAASPAQLHTPFIPPWLALQPRNKQESQQGVIDTLNDSFKDVGLLPSNYNVSRHAVPSSERQKKIASGHNNSDPFKHIPDDSLYMLLPLWPGDTDPRSEIIPPPFDKPVIQNDRRQYLLVYYKIPETVDEENKQNQNEKESKKRSRTSPTSSHDSITKRDERASILLSSFHITARLVPYQKLQGTGVRVPDEGLTVTGPLKLAFEQMPPPATEETYYEYVIGICHSRDTGVEFYPDGLVKMGLCVQTSVQMQMPTSELDEPPEPDVRLTPIGRAVLEMVWSGALALTSFGLGT